jgi:hypothetical protein
MPVARTYLIDHVDAVFCAVTGTLVKEKNISLTAFGVFEVSERPERGGRHPRTGQRRCFMPLPRIEKTGALSRRTGNSASGAGAKKLAE